MKQNEESKMHFLFTVDEKRKGNKKEVEVPRGESPTERSVVSMETTPLFLLFFFLLLLFLFLAMVIVRGERSSAAVRSVRGLYEVNSLKLRVDGDFHLCLF